jgi:hypothetical protein
LTFSWQDALCPLPEDGGGSAAKAPEASRPAAADTIAALVMVFRFIAASPAAA